MLCSGLHNFLYWELVGMKTVNYHITYIESIPLFYDLISQSQTYFGRENGVLILIILPCVPDAVCSFKRRDIITFRVSRRPREMYCGHARLCVCLCVCPRPHATLLDGPGCNLGEW